MELKKRIRLSKLLSYILRHNPRILHTDVDEEGYLEIDVQEVARRLRKLRGYEWVREEDILEILRNDEKGRFEIKRGRIRALYGHTIKKVRIKYEEAEINVLFHGTTRRKVARIQTEGLKPMRRNYVHLSPSIEEARIVGGRREGETVILKIDAAKMKKDGLKIWKASERVYLARYIPPRYIQVMEEETFHEAPYNE